MTVALPVSRIVNVSIALSRALAQQPNFNTLLILGTGTSIDVQERIREYSSVAEVSADFGAQAEETLGATAWFGQRPQPTSVQVGRWAKTASRGQLVGGAVAAADQLMSVWNPITSGSAKVTVDGVERIVAAMDFSGASNMNGVAAVIQDKLDDLAVGTTVVWDAVRFRFVVSSGTTGTDSSVSFFTNHTTGTPVSDRAGLLSTDGGRSVAGIAAETALQTVALLDNEFSDSWYGLVIPSATPADHLLVANYVDASIQKHFYGVTTQDANVLVSSSTGDVAYLMKAQGNDHAMIQYSSTSPYAVISAMARILTTNWNGVNTAITLKFKAEPGVVAETLSVSQANALEAKNCNVFVNYNNDSSILEQGQCPSGQYVDSVVGADWFASYIQTNVYNVLYGSNTKIPQTDAGNHVLATSIENSCDQARQNGLLGPGYWNNTGFGQLAEGDYLPKGYYVYTPPIITQAPGDRAKRKSVPFQVAAKLGGAIHSVDVLVNVNN